MNTKKYKKVLQDVAKKYGVSPEEVEREIAFGIRMAQRSSDFNAQVAWAAMPRKGIEPTPEEVVAHISRAVKKKL